MANPEEIKRRGYLSFFKDGVADGLFVGKQDYNKLFSAYYKQGYDYGLVLYNKQVKPKDSEYYYTNKNKWEKKNGR